MQVQFSLLDRRPLNGMLQYASDHGIKLLTYGSVAGGLLSDRCMLARGRVPGHMHHALGHAHAHARCSETCCCLCKRYVEPAPKPGFFGAKRWKNVDLSTSSLKMYWAVCRQAGGMDWWKELLQVISVDRKEARLLPVMVSCW